MTISSASRKAGPFFGNGVTTSFPFTFKVFQASDLQLIHTSAVGIDSPLVLNSDYSIALNVDQNASPGGSITYPLQGTALATGEKLTATGVLAALQDTHITNGGNFFANNIEDQMDYLTILVQQCIEQLQRSLTGSTSDVAPNFSLGTSVQRALTYVAFDAQGNVSLAASLPSGTLSQASIVSFLGADPIQRRTVAEIAASVVPVNLTYLPGNVLRYGADPTGTLNSDAAFAAATAQASHSQGADITVPAGTFLIGSGIVVNAPGVRIKGAGIGLSILKANANNVIILKLCQQFDSAADLQINANGFTGVDGLVLAPANELLTNAVNFNSYVDVERVWITNGCNNGLRMRGGPTVAGGDSQLFYCQFRSVFIENCTRGIWMQNSVSLGHGGPNACSFVGCRVAGDTGIANTGLQIDMGTGNMFFALHFEGIAFGTSPSSTPTAVVISEANAAGGDNDDNQFFGTRCEANTHDLDNLNTLTQFYGGVWSQAKFGAAQNPTIMLTGDVSLQPLILPGLQYSEGLSGFPSGYWGMTKEIADTGKEWQPYTLSTAVMTNVVSIAGGSVSNSRQLSNVVSWAAAFIFDASVGATQVTITPPVAPNTAQYTTTAGNNPFYTASVFNGTGYSQVPAGWTSAGKFYVAAPSSGWNTGGNNNQIFIQVDYHT